MIYFFRIFLFFILTLPYAQGHANDKPSDPIAIYLTWQHDPTSTMTIQWITDAGQKDDMVHYQIPCAKNWQQASGSHQPMPQRHPYLIHRIELVDLLPDTYYSFRFSKEGRSYRFRTMPQNLTAPIRFVEGGDIYHDSIETVSEINRLAASKNPHFALLGGDLAYAATKSEALPENLERWLTFLKTWTQTMVAPDGRLIPMIPTIGNHDTQGRYNQTPEQAQFYYALFAMPGPKGYNVLDFGQYMSVVILDSGHTHPVEGEQSEWLENTLRERNRIPHKFALYHVPAYPSVRQIDSKLSAVVRKHWTPIFEKHNLKAAFEHHDHGYKRTVRIKDDKEDPAGVLYMGDGAWGVSLARLPRAQQQAWYLAKTSPTTHFILVTLDGQKTSFQAIDYNGAVIDSYEIRD